MAKKKKVGRPKIKDRKMIKEHVLTFRVNSKELANIKKAVALYGWTSREFFRNVVLAMVEKTLSKEKKQDENRIITSFDR